MTEKILVVDRDVNVSKSLTCYLEEQYLEVIQSYSGEDALRLIQREHPDLVLLDVELQDMPGWELIRRTRDVSDVPIIIITRLSMERDKLKGFQLGADDYVTKPFSLPELNARVQAVLNRTRYRSQLDANPLSFGDLSINIRKREVYRNGELVSLAPTEFRLLEILIRYSGAPISENDLIKKVWGDYRQEETAAVRRYIWLLRKKLEDDPSDPKWIKTVRGVGYCFERRER